MAFLKDWYMGFAEWLPLDDWFGVSEGFEQGFIAGVAILLVLVLLVWFVIWRLGRRPTAKGISVAGEGGDLFITLNAVEEFVKRIMYEFEEANLRTVGLKARSQQLLLDVEIAVVPGTDLVPLRDVLQRRIITDAQEKLGINRPVRVNIHVRSLEADPDKIVKKSRKAGLTEVDTKSAEDESRELG